MGEQVEEESYRAVGVPFGGLAAYPYPHLAQGMNPQLRWGLFRSGQRPAHVLILLQLHYRFIRQRK